MVSFREGLSFDDVLPHLRDALLRVGRSSGGGMTASAPLWIVTRRAAGFGNTRDTAAWVAAATGKPQTWPRQRRLRKTWRGDFSGFTVGKAVWCNSSSGPGLSC